MNEKNEFFQEEFNQELRGENYFRILDKLIYFEAGVDLLYSLE
jgi:hypothetical protein